jgi:hypothetical protein
MSRRHRKYEITFLAPGPAVMAVLGALAPSIRVHDLDGGCFLLLHWAPAHTSGDLSSIFPIRRSRSPATSP